MKYMLDTNICIYSIKNKPQQVFERVRENLHEGLCISTITLAELEQGIANSGYPEKNRISLACFLAALSVYQFDEAAAKEYGKICTRLRRKGTPIGTMDMLIVAHAKSKGCILVTNNVREFERVEGLEIENWAE